jgi:hypothetical protein
VGIGSGVNPLHIKCSLGKGTASQVAEKLGIRIRVCLQAYRKSLKMRPASAAEVKVLPDVKGFMKSAGCPSNSRARIFLAPSTEVRIREKNVQGLLK